MTIHAFAADLGQFELSISPRLNIPRIKIQRVVERLVILEARFPGMFARVRENGFHRVRVQPLPAGDIFRAHAWAETDQTRKTIILYPGLFADEVSTMNIDITLMHELLHAWDCTHEEAWEQLALIGWMTGAENDGFPYALDSTLRTLWVTQAEVLQIQTELDYLRAHLPRVQYVEWANQAVRRFGYPSVYAITGGPFEAFAEIGAYVAIDPEVSKYVPEQTVEWFREKVLN